MISVIVGACSLTIVPIALELGCEITRNSEASSALLWLRLGYYFSRSNFLALTLVYLAVISLVSSSFLVRFSFCALFAHHTKRPFVVVMSALRAPVDASPPFNMMHSLIFQGTLVCVGTVGVVFFHGQQRRRERDVQAFLSTSEPVSRT